MITAAPDYRLRLSLFSNYSLDSQGPLTIPKGTERLQWAPAGKARSGHHQAGDVCRGVSLARTDFMLPLQRAMDQPTLIIRRMLAVLLIVVSIAALKLSVQVVMPLALVHEQLYRVPRTWLR